MTLPKDITLPGDITARINRVDTSDIGYDLGTGMGDEFVASDTGKSAPPIPGYGPEVEPSNAGLLAAITAPKPVAVPVSVTRRQLFLALLAHDAQLTRANLRTMVTGEANLIEFEEAIEFRRDHPLVVQLAGALSVDADELFTLAATL